MNGLTRSLVLGGSGPNASYTAAQLSAMAAAGTLTPLATYVASDTGDRYWASGAGTLRADPPGGSAEPWLVQPGTFVGNPLQDGTLGTTSVTVDRTLQFAGMPDRLVISGKSRAGGTVQWGTLSTAETDYPGSAVNTVYTASPYQIEGTGSAWLKAVDKPNGEQHLAMGRIIKYNDGRLRMMHNADDALISSCPRVQMFGGPLIHRQGYYRIYISPQFGDATTPWPAYVSGKDSALFFQLKGTAGSPIMSLRAEYDSPTSDTLTVSLSTRQENSGPGPATLASVSGLAKGVRHDIVLDVALDWTSAGYLGFWLNGSLIAARDGNTLMSDFADQPPPMWGIYRYQHVGAKAPDDCAIIFHLAGVKNGLAPLRAV